MMSLGGLTGHVAHKAWNDRAPAMRMVCVLLACIAAQAWAQNGVPTYPNPGKVALSREDQAALGKQASAQVKRQMPVLPDSSPESHYIQQLGQKLAATFPTQDAWPFEFHVLAQKDINALALPGGPVFISVGTIRSAANEAVLAGVMAHEMAHVYMQHSARHAGKAQAAGNQSGTAAGSPGQPGAGEAAEGLAGQLRQMGIQIRAHGMIANYSQSDELQADYVGTMILYKAGYNPQAMAVFFETLEAEGGDAPAALLASHPDPGDRQQAIHNEMSTWAPKSFSGDSAGFAQVRLHAMGVKAYSGDEIAQGAQSGQWAQAANQSGGAGTNQALGAGRDPGNGAAPNQSGGDASPISGEASGVSGGGAGSGGPALESIAPSQHMVEADLGVVKIHRPENWPVKLPQKQGQWVIIAPAAGLAGDNVGYGMLVSGFAPEQTQGLSLDEVTSHLVQQFQKTNGLKPIGDVKPITVSGREGRSGMFQSSSPFPGKDGNPLPERDWLVTVPQSDGGVVFMVFVAPEPDFNRLKLSYNAMLESSEFK